MTDKMNALIGGSRGIGAAAVRPYPERVEYGVYHLNSERKRYAEEQIGSSAFAPKYAARVAETENFARRKGTIRTGRPSHMQRGISYCGLFQTMKEEDWDRVIDVNPKGAANACMNKYSPWCKEKRCIPLVSSCGDCGASREAAYSRLAGSSGPEKTRQRTGVVEFASTVSPPV